MELRNRRRLNPDDLDTSSSSAAGANNGVTRAFRRLDMFPKPKQDFRKKQNILGGAISAVTIAIISLLVLYDFTSYVFGWNAYRTELSVDRGVSAAVPFEIDIDFGGVPCHELSLDAVDASGIEQEDLDHELLKTPLDGYGNKVQVGAYRYYDRRQFEKHAKQEAANNIPSEMRRQFGRHNIKDPQYCGPCFVEPLNVDPNDETQRTVAEAIKRHIENDPKHKEQCCNTCDEVSQMYKKHELPMPPLNQIEQCIMELSKKHPGCNVRGTIFLRKVQGAFFFAPGKGQTLGPMGGHVHIFSIDQLLRFNSSHIIRRFRIGDPNIPRFSARGVQFPLEGRQFYTPPGSTGSVKYRLQIVPTSYQIAQSASDASFGGGGGGGSSANNNDHDNDEPDVSYEYAVSEWNKVNMAGLFATLFGGQTPSVMFRYEFFSMQLTHIFDRPPLSVFLVRACSIIGGLFVILGIVDRVSQFLAQKAEWQTKLLGPVWAEKIQELLSHESSVM